MTWEQFFNWLMTWEGRTVHQDFRDPGKQTAWGISRRYNPNWAGWSLVDRGIDRNSIGAAQNGFPEVGILGQIELGYEPLKSGVVGAARVNQSPPCPLGKVATRDAPRGLSAGVAWIVVDGAAFPCHEPVEELFPGHLLAPLFTLDTIISSRSALSSCLRNQPSMSAWYATMRSEHSLRHVWHSWRVIPSLPYD